ncbi:aldehyde dehydrogenase family protein [Streptomyces sp. NPDC057963]|uniref:aldehyde dehydrogenase family protein n=1 Tax=Streptomyces sp. NPDC057963 TaxID=3346290 RepID=UPI0036E085AD
MIVMPDADLDQAVDALIGAGYGSAGERCMAISVAVPVGEGTADRLVTALKEHIATLRIGRSDDAEADFGPLVSRDAVERVRRYVDIGVTDGAEPVVDGRDFFLTRAVGKAKVMEVCLTGRTMDATEAERAGLVSRGVPADELLGEALAVAETVAGMPLPVAMTAKEAVSRAFETALAEGARFERRLFHAVFATEDQKEGMTAFVDKRPPCFRHSLPMRR